ncbi:Uncharacterised protein [Leclercia adecarboxylata]|uniref:Uncharacterized protein n=1 Tax=Leclercia adecarboxylata TaxID=83655 RepID=A0A4U9I9T0_9ENTR|nr:Uncharacterised protein [Leclercia adecarboxylata]
MQASLLESGGRPVTRRAEQAVWPASTLPGIRPQFASKAVYDYRTDTTVNQPIVEENSQAGFDIVYAMPVAQKSGLWLAGAPDPRAARLLMELVRE